MNRPAQIFASIAISAVLGVMTFCACMALAVYIARSAGIITMGPGGLSDGPNKGSFLGSVLLCFPVIGSMGVMWAAYAVARKWLEKKAAERAARLEAED